MYDLISVVFVLGFFALMVLYVQGCDRILGPDELETSENLTGTPEPGAAPAGGEAVAA